MTTLVQHRINVAERAADRLIEALTRRKIDRLITPVETKLHKTVSALFVKQGNAVARRLRPLDKYLAESMSSDFDELFDDAIFDTSSDMQDAIETAVKSGVLLGGKSLIAEFRASVNFSLTNPRAVAYTEQHAAEAIAGIDDTSKADIRRLVVLAVEHGTSYAELARQIKTRYAQFAGTAPQRHIRSRAELVAITETGNAYQAGNLAAAYQLKDSGIKIQKYWFSRDDDRRSDGCRVNTEAGWIDIDKDFPSGDATPLRFPGCRCVAQYRRAK